MQHLNSLILEINEKIKKNIKSHVVKSHGLVRHVKRSDTNGKFTNSYIDLEGATVHLNTDYEIYFYHRLNSERYRANKPEAHLSLIVISKMDSDEFFKQELLKNSQVELESIDYDSYKILKQETNKEEYDFKNFLYQINYTLTYSLRKCLSL